MFEIYTGKGGTRDGSPKGVISRLLHGAGATGTTGRILYTDNFYTSMAVMKHIFLSFSMLLVGTYALTKKKSRTAEDFPFAKLSNGALKRVNRGWKRMARRTSDYSYHMNGVDHKDRDTADWTVSLKSNWFYLRIFYWLFDGVLHAMYSIIKVVADDKAHPWHKYLSKHLGCYKFQMDLANDLISRGIGMDWSDVEDSNARPDYVRKHDWVPCACTTCFFCMQ